MQCDIVEITKGFADKLKNLVEKSEIPKKWIAEDIGISEQTLYRIINFKNKNFNIYTIDKLCVYFDLYYQIEVGKKNIKDNYKGEIMGLQIIDACYVVSNENEGEWIESADYLILKLDGFDIAFPKDIEERCMDNIISGYFKKKKEMKKRR